VTYNITETAVADYTPSYSLGCSGQVAASGNATCTVTNTYTPSSGPTVRVFKDVVGGTNVPGDFTINASIASGGTISPASFVGSGTGTDVSVTIGKAYSITETPNANYITAYSAGCNGTLASAVTATCRITNTFKFGTLIVKKLVVGGALQPNDFRLNVSVNGGTASPSSFDGSSAGTVVIVTPGKSFNVGETAVANYTETESGVCSNKLQAGQTGTCTVTNTASGGGGPAASGTFDLVARPYAADPASGPVEYLLLTDGLANRTYFFTSTGPRTIHVEVGLEPILQAATSTTDPVQTLRFGQGSRTQLLDCDHSPRNPDEEIATGCYTPYAESISGDCSAYGSGGSTLPPATYSPPPATCVAVANGSAVGPTIQGLDQRFGKIASDCLNHPNKWAVYKATGKPPDPDDVRYVVLVLTDYNTFSGGGAGKVPVRKFAGFYVTGWSSASSSCAAAGGNEPSPNPPPTGNKAEVWGHFVNYVGPSSNGDPGPDLCAFDDSQICIGVLTR
jgi:hypothetical protein